MPDPGFAVDTASEREYKFDKDDIIAVLREGETPEGLIEKAGGDPELTRRANNLESLSDLGIGDTFVIPVNARVEPPTEDEIPDSVSEEIDSPDQQQMREQIGEPIDDPIQGLTLEGDDKSKAGAHFQIEEPEPKIPNFSTGPEPPSVTFKRTLEEEGLDRDIAVPEPRQKFERLKASFNNPDASTDQEWGNWWKEILNIVGLMADPEIFISTRKLVLKSQHLEWKRQFAEKEFEFEQQQAAIENQEAFLDRQVDMANLQHKRFVEENKARRDLLDFLDDNKESLRSEAQEISEQEDISFEDAIKRVRVRRAKAYIDQRIGREVFNPVAPPDATENEREQIKRQGQQRYREFLKDIRDIGVNRIRQRESSARIQADVEMLTALMPALSPSEFSDRMMDMVDAWRELRIPDRDIQDGIRQLTDLAENLEDEEDLFTTEDMLDEALRNPNNARLRMVKSNRGNITQQMLEERGFSNIEELINVLEQGIEKDPTQTGDMRLDAGQLQRMVEEVTVEQNSEDISKGAVSSMLISRYGSPPTSVDKQENPREFQHKVAMGNLKAKIQYPDGAIERFATKILQRSPSEKGAISLALTRAVEAHLWKLSLQHGGEGVDQLIDLAYPNADKIARTPKVLAGYAYDIERMADKNPDDFWGFITDYLNNRKIDHSMDETDLMMLLSLQDNYTAYNQFVENLPDRDQVDFTNKLLDEFDRLRKQRGLVSRQDVDDAFRTAIDESASESMISAIRRHYNRMMRSLQSVGEAFRENP